MAGSIHVVYVSPEDVRKIVSDSRIYAVTNNIKFPKVVSICGDCSGNGYIAFTSNAVKQVIMDTIVKNGHKVVGTY